MNDTFNVTLEKAANTVKIMAQILKCDYETVWKNYTHTLVKESVSWDEVKELLLSNE